MKIITPSMFLSLQNKLNNYILLDALFARLMIKTIVKVGIIQSRKQKFQF